MPSDHSNDDVIKDGLLHKKAVKKQKLKERVISKSVEPSFSKQGKKKDHIFQANDLTKDSIDQKRTEARKAELRQTLTGLCEPLAQEHDKQQIKSKSKANIKKSKINKKVSNSLKNEPALERKNLQIQKKSTIKQETTPTTLKKKVEVSVAEDSCDKKKNYKKEEKNVLKLTFPSGRIKKIIHSNEEIGKMGTTVPAIIGIATEQFVRDLTRKIVKSTANKKLSVKDVKNAVKGVSMFDFIDFIGDDC